MPFKNGVKNQNQISWVYAIKSDDNPKDQMNAISWPML